MTFNVELNPRGEFRLRYDENGAHPFYVEANAEEARGMVTVDEDEDESGGRVVEIRGDDVITLQPFNVVIRPGRSVTWKNKRGKRVRIHS